MLNIVKYVVWGLPASRFGMTKTWLALPVGILNAYRFYRVKGWLQSLTT
jgi:hypothetical protein